MTTNKIKVWSLPTRLIHWTLVSAFCVAWYWSDSQLGILNHVYAGYVAAGAIVAKWLYGSLVRDFAGFSRFKPNPPAAGAYLLDLFKGKAKRYIGHNPAGALAIYIMLSLGSSTITSGFIAFEQINVIFDYETWQTIHHNVAHVWLLAIEMHVAGVIIGSMLHNENLVTAMITGYKKRRLRKCVPQLIKDNKWTEPDTFERADTECEISETLRQQYIAEAAYYIAEKRGGQHGYDQQDWVEAEKQINEMLKNNKAS